MQSGRLLSLLLVVVLLCVVAAIVGIIRARITWSRRENQKRILQRIMSRNQVKIDRLIEFERAELIRKRLPKENLDDLMDRAIKRWERDNAFAVSIY
jgi:hypothetical protein